jgi:cation diffusion facilitator CzcD-associated flavoprotein CzcO
MRIAVIGAGISGIAPPRPPTKFGHETVLFERAP